MAGKKLPGIHRASVQHRCWQQERSGNFSGTRPCETEFLLVPGGHSSGWPLLSETGDKDLILPQLLQLRWFQPGFHRSGTRHKHLKHRKTSAYGWVNIFHWHYSTTPALNTFFPMTTHNTHRHWGKLKRRGFCHLPGFHKAFPAPGWDYRSKKNE